MVRDLSRFGRNYLETGTYLERILPHLGIRFISVKEQLDTFSADGSAGSLMVPLQNLINDLYAKDISKKIHSVFRVRREEKTFTWSSVPYGYRWNDDRTGIIRNEGQAVVVREIFDMFLDGEGSYHIAKHLNEKGIRTATRDKKGGDSIWTAQAVLGILKNPAYTGVYAWGRSRSELFRNMPTVRVPREEWAVRENDHEPIIEMEEYDRTQELIARSSEKKKEALERTDGIRNTCIDLFAGKLVCGDCGSRMYFRRAVANNGQVYGGYHCRSDEMRRSGCTRHNISKKKLDSKVLSVIGSQIDLALETEELLARLSKSEYRKTRETELRRRIHLISGKLRNIQDKRKRLYEDHVDGILDADEYLSAKAHYETRAALLDEEYDRAVESLDMFNECISSQNKWVMMMKDAENIPELSGDLVESVIERVVVYEEEAIEVVFRHQDIFEYTKEYIEEVGIR